MTPTFLMEAMQKRIQNLLNGNYSSEQPSGNPPVKTKVPVEVYAGFPPVKDTAKERSSYIYTLVVQHKDEKETSNAKIEIGFSIYDDDKKDGWRSLYNLVEHIRQDLLKFPFLERKYRLEPPLIFDIYDREQPFPQWLGTITANYSVARPHEEGFSYDDFQEAQNGFGKYERWKEK